MCSGTDGVDAGLELADVPTDRRDAPDVADAPVDRTDVADVPADVDPAVQACVDACRWATICGLDDAQVAACVELCTTRAWPRALEECIVLAPATGCFDLYRCFAPVDAVFCGDIAPFAASCGFGSAAACQSSCQASPPVETMFRCMIDAVRAADCAAYSACSDGVALPDGFVGRLCTMMVGCSLATDPVDCVTGCPPPFLAPRLVSCVEAALAAASCVDLVFCFGGGPTPELCGSACGFAATCNGWDAAMATTCVSTCTGGGFGGPFSGCAQGAIGSMDCAAMNSCLGDTGQPPPAGYCASTCGFERDVCSLIAPADYDTCVAICEARTAAASFYACRQTAVAAGNCTGYLDCAM